MLDFSPTQRHPEFPANRTGGAIRLARPLAQPAPGNVASAVSKSFPFPM
jgi:hypothetical protein